MKKILISAAAIALLATTASAKAAGDAAYVKGSLGYGVGQKFNYKTDLVSPKKGKGLVGNVGAGMAFANGLRSDAEFYFDDGIDSKIKNRAVGGNNSKFKVKTMGLFVNGYFDIKNSSAFTPYVMAGLGWAHNNTSFKSNGVNLIKNKKTNSLAYQAGVGVSYAVSKNVALDVGYRYIDKNIKIREIATNKSHRVQGIHAGLVGVRVSF